MCEREREAEESKEKVTSIWGTIAFDICSMIEFTWMKRIIWRTKQASIWEYQGKGNVPDKDAWCSLTAGKNWIAEAES